MRRLVGLLAVLVFLMPRLALAADYVPISGVGSTWSANALDQWRKNVQQYGMRISYSATGSTDGRNQFKAGQADFGVSEIPYGLKDSGVVDTPPDRGYAYMPIVAGGTSFMYNLMIGGARVTNLRLSGENITKIFTGVITNWSDPAIKSDNPGLKLPARKIIPVVRSDGSGTSAQFTTYMANQYGGIWDDFCRKAGRATPCGFTSNYPLTAPVVGQSGSLGVTNYVRQAQSEGSITYVEYSFARNAGFPVVKVLNKAGYYIEPTATAVAVALLRAKINPDLTQELGDVYVDLDDRTYPLSSYSYMILPTSETSKFNAEKGKTLSDFAYYFLCEGQQQADQLGYSPLPINLVQAGLKQVERIPGSTKKQTDITKCNNPTFSPDGTNLLAKNAPRPRPCDKAGPVQCAEGTGGATNQTPVSGGADKPSAPAGPANPAAPAGAAPGAGAAADATGVPADAPIDPDTGQPAGSGGTRGTSSALAEPVSVEVFDSGQAVLFTVIAVVLLTGLIIGPPVLSRALRRGGQRD